MLDIISSQKFEILASLFYLFTILENNFDFDFAVSLCLPLDVKYHHVYLSQPDWGRRVAERFYP